MGIQRGHRARPLEWLVERLIFLVSLSAIVMVFLIFVFITREALPVILGQMNGSLAQKVIPPGDLDKIPQRQLAEYFAGERRSFEVPLRAEGTEFQRRVWRELQRIPYGSSCSYGEVARAIGRPSACRAVGAANGRNPLSIVVPCHRVIGQNGKLTGFGGGRKAKAHLLELEKRVMMAGRSTSGPARPVGRSSGSCRCRG